jgi:pyruvate formate lyase activating enzyme
MEDIIKAVKNPIVELLIITGGEPLAQGDDFIDALRYLRQHITKPIRIDTNGTSPSLVELIKNEKLADGFAMDIKFPYWLDDQDNILHKITGVKDIDKSNILKTMRLVDAMPFSLFRTVRYPILSNDLLDNIVNYVKSNFKSPHFVNTYYTFNNVH